MIYIVVMTVIVPVNLLTTPENPWFVLPLVGWGTPLAFHAAWAMGLLDALFGQNSAHTPELEFCKKACSHDRY